MIKETFKSLRVHCIHGDLIEGVTLDKCHKCNFFNGEVADNKGNITAIDCLRADIPSFRCHVTAFTMAESDGEWLYSARYYNKETDGQIEGEDPYDFCQKCCFSKKLANGHVVCLLRCGTRSDVDRFMCYEGEIWERKKIEDYSDDE